MKIDTIIHHANTPIPEVDFPAPEYPCIIYHVEMDVNHIVFVCKRRVRRMRTRKYTAFDIYADNRTAHSSREQDHISLTPARQCRGLGIMCSKFSA